MSSVGVERPMGVSILVALHFLSGVPLVLLGLSGLVEGSSPIFEALGIVLIAIGLVPLVIGWGLYDRVF